MYILRLVSNMTTKILDGTRGGLTPPQECFIRNLAKVLLPYPSREHTVYSTYYKVAVSYWLHDLPNGDEWLVLSVKDWDK